MGQYLLLSSFGGLSCDLRQPIYFSSLKCLPFCTLEPRDTVCFPARTIHIVVSVTEDNQWNCFSSQVVLPSDEQANKRKKSPSFCFTNGVLGMCNGVTKKLFAARRRVQTSIKLTLQFFYILFLARWVYRRIFWPLVFKNKSCFKFKVVKGVRFRV